MYAMALKFGTFVSYILGKIPVKFDRFVRYFKEIRENVSIISEQPSYILICSLFYPYFMLSAVEIFLYNGRYNDLICS